MAVPKKRTSVSRKGLRRAGQTHKMYRKHTATCSNCGDIMLPHAACSSCGHYKGKQIFAVKAKTDSAEQVEA